MVISLVGDGGFGQNPSVLATAREVNLGVIWVVMNNNAFGTIAGLAEGALRADLGTTFPTAAERVAELRGDRQRRTA